MNIGMTTLLALFTSTLAGLAQDESDFYRETIDDHELVKNLRTDYGVDGKANASDSERLQKAIDEVSAAGGGRILIPRGTYRFGRIGVTSNVHLLIKRGTVISPYVTDAGRAVSVFVMGGGGMLAENVSIRGVGGAYTIKLFEHKPGAWCFTLGSVKNFLISDFVVHDVDTKFSCVGLGISTADPKKKTGYSWPHNGVVKNGKGTNMHYGYGLVQIQAGENVLFKDLDGDGGVTLRVETGWSRMNDLQVGRADRIFGRNISCRNGNAGAMIAPHSMHNGSVDIDGVTTVSCGFGVRIEGGYISKKYKNPDLTAGTFTSVRIRNVDATFGTDAEVKWQHLKYIPDDKVKYIVRRKGQKVSKAPAVAAVINSPRGYEDAVQISNVTARGFGKQKPIIGPGDAYRKR